MLSCREITELATAYAEGAMSLGDRLRFLMHLSMCKHCRLYIRQLRLTIQTVGALPKPVEPPSPAAREALLKQFRNWKSKSNL
jgi:anti-sigma factor ChrR (cupin superfamily)